MVARKWPLVFVLLFLFLGELFLPGKGWTQLLSDTGLFYFTGAHNPLRTPLFREFMGGEGLRAGPVRLHPFFGVAGVYTDNAFKRNTDRRSDLLTTIAPGLQAYLPFRGGQHSVLLDYRANQYLYKEFTENNVLAQDAQGHVSFNFLNGLTMDLQGGRIDGFDPRGSEEDIQAREITKWRIMSVLSEIEFSGPRAGIRLRSSFVDWHFKNNDQALRRDRTNARASLTFSANVTPSTSALLGVQIGKNEYDTNKQLDSFSYGAFTGFHLAPIGQLSGDFQIGYTILNFDRAPIELPEESPLSEGATLQELLFMRGNLHWNPSSRLSIRISPFRQIRPTGFLGTNTMTQTGVNVIGVQTLTARVGLRGMFAWINADFDTDRKDNRYQWRMGVQYRTVKWFGFRLEYIFEKRDSTVDFANYYSNTAMFSIEGIL